MTIGYGIKALWIAALVTLLTPRGHAADESLTPQGTSTSYETLSVQFKLNDGSRIWASPIAPIIHVQTDYGKMNIDWNIVRGIDRGTKGNANLIMNNGDHLRVVLLDKQWPVRWLVGKTTIPPSLVTAARVRPRASSATIIEGLVLFLDFESIDDSVRDLSGHGNDAKNVGVESLKSGIDGAGASFSGKSESGAYLIIDNSDSLTSMEDTGELTIALWVRVRSIPREFPVLINKGGNHPPLANNGYEICLNANGDDDITFLSGRWHTRTDNVYGQLINRHMNEWRHIATTANRATGRVEIYVDGTKYPTPTTTGYLDPNHVIFRTDHKLYIGGPSPEHHQNRAWFNGDMDELMIFNRVLSTEEITTLVRSTPSSEE